MCKVFICTIKQEGRDKKNKLDKRREKTNVFFKGKYIAEGALGDTFEWIRKKDSCFGL